MKYYNTLLFIQDQWGFLNKDEKVLKMYKDFRKNVENINGK